MYLFKNEKKCNSYMQIVIVVVVMIILVQLGNEKIYFEIGPLFLNNVNNRAIYYFDLFFNLTQITIQLP